MALGCRRLTGLLAFTGVIAALVAGAVLGAAVPVGAVSPGVGAGYAPCSVITWRYAGSGEPASGAGMIGDVRGALGLVAGRTGVLFVEAPVGAVADHSNVIYLHPTLPSANKASEKGRERSPSVPVGDGRFTH